jgi:UDP-2-acetamido-3-amino-2,3-dideoxy-glucuronate N-acetyltransferase
VKTRYDDKKRWLVRTTVEKGSTIGANATILAGVRVGRYAMVGAGSVVVRNVDPFTMVVGNPARKVGYLCRCGRRTGLTLPTTECPECGMAPESFKDAQNVV